MGGVVMLEPILCKCCAAHPEQELEAQPVVCPICGEPCRCEGCIAEVEAGWSGKGKYPLSKGEVNG